MSRDIVTPTPYVTWPRGMPRDIVTPITVAKYHGAGRYGAVIEAVNSDGTYEVLYDDGDLDDKVPPAILC